MVVKLISLIQKNFRLIIRSRSSALIVVFGPLLLILLMGIAFNTANVYGIRVGYLSENEGELVKSILTELQNKQFSTLKSNTKEECLDGIKSGLFHICAYFTQDFGINIGELIFYVDPSRVNLVYMIMDAVSAGVQAKTKEVGGELVQSVVESLEKTEASIQDKRNILPKLVEDYKNTQSSLKSALADLSGIDLAFNIEDFRLFELKNKIRDLQGDTTGATTIALDLEEQLKLFVNKANNAGSVKNKAYSKVAEVNNIIEGNINILASLDSSLQSIMNDINLIKRGNVQKIVAPINTRVEHVTGEKTFLNYLFPTLVAMIIMFVSILLASMLEIRERSAKIFFKNFITPTSNAIFIFSNYLTNLLIVFLQLIILFVAALIFTKEQLISVLGSIFVILLIVTSVFILLGMIIGNIFRSEETNMIASISIGFILLFFSSTILPIETLPGVIKSVANFNPFYISQNILSKVMLFHVGLAGIMNSILILLGTLAVLIVIMSLIRKFVPSE